MVEFEKDIKNAETLWYRKRCEFESSALYIDKERRFPFCIGYSVCDAKNIKDCYVKMLPFGLDYHANMQLRATFRIWRESPYKVPDAIPSIDLAILCSPGDFKAGSAIRCKCAKSTQSFATHFTTHSAASTMPLYYQILNAEVINDNDVGEKDVTLEKLRIDSDAKFAKAFNAQKFMDCQIEVGNKVFMASQYVLAAHSEVFATMFESGMNESDSFCIKIADFDPPTVLNMLAYLHSGGAVFPDNDVEQLQLSLIAERYNLTSLMKQCSMVLKNSINPKTFPKILIFAFKHDREDLKNECLKFVASIGFKKTLINSEEFVHFSKVDPSCCVEICRALINDQG